MIDYGLVLRDVHKCVVQSNEWCIYGNNSHLCTTAMERIIQIGGKLKYSEKIQSVYHFLHYKSQRDGPGIDTGTGR